MNFDDFKRSKLRLSLESPIRESIREFRRHRRERSFHLQVPQSKRRRLNRQLSRSLNVISQMENTPDSRKSSISKAKGSPGTDDQAVTDSESHASSHGYSNDSHSRSSSPKIVLEQSPGLMPSTAGSVPSMPRNNSGSSGSTALSFDNQTYKSRTEEFRKIFGKHDDLFVIDYSCALQKDILVQGRMYLSLAHVSFYSNILGKWETKLSIMFKDVSSIKKDKTARVIPNAIQVVTKSGDRHFFTTLNARDKTYMIMFRLWQYALMDEPIDMQILYSWIREGYGDEQGGGDGKDVASEPEDHQFTGTLTNGFPSPVYATFDMPGTDGSDAGSPSPPDPRTPIVARALGDEQQTNGTTPAVLPLSHKSHSAVPLSSADKQASPAPSAPLPPHLSQCRSDSTLDSESKDLDGDIECPCTSHYGKETLNSVYEVNVDQLFLLLFTDSVFMRSLMKNRNVTNYVVTEWCPDSNNPEFKSRQLNYTVAITHSMGPKSAPAIEKQTVQSCSITGRLYVIKAEIQNLNIPYADTFYVLSTYCLSRIDANTTRLRAHGGAAYRKSCWGVVKSFIDKNVISGVSDYTHDLDVRLRSECERARARNGPLDDSTAALPQSQRRRRRSHKRRTDNSSDERGWSSRQRVPGSPSGYSIVPVGLESLAKGIIALLVFIFLLNGLLFYKLWHVQSDLSDEGRLAADYDLANLRMLINSGKISNEEWLRLLEYERVQYRSKVQAWRGTIHELSHALQKLEVTLQRLDDDVTSVHDRFDAILPQESVLDRQKGEGNEEL